MKRERNLKRLELFLFERPSKRERKESLKLIICNRTERVLIGKVANYPNFGVDGNVLINTHMRGSPQ